MALINDICFQSETLGMQVRCSVILPQRKKTSHSAGKYQTLYLLHGQGRDHMAWLNLSSIEQYVRGLSLAVVMPDANISFYANMAQGGRYFDYIADELPQIMQDFFPLSDAREDNFIVGQSMGGVGSLKIGIARPKQLYHAWGLEDFILDDAREVRDFFQSFPGNPFDYTCEECAGGHN